MDSTLPILAVDHGKINSVLCWLASSSGELHFRTIRTTPEDLWHEFTREARARSPTPGWDADRCE
jgi:hypothetical protein